MRRIARTIDHRAHPALGVLSRFALVGALIAAAPGAPVAHAGKSLYDEANFRSFTADQRALRVGDSLTVLVVENASATTSANTQTRKSGGVGLTGTFNADNTNHTAGAKVDVNDDFAGRGSISRSGKVAAQLTVTVRAVQPNGDLMVSGRQLIVLNDEKQEIVLSGRVRPQDISENNAVLSSRLADANISYVGDGILAEKQKPGFISRFLTWLGLL